MELTEYFTCQFNLIRSLEYQTCPGEKACGTEKAAIHRIYSKRRYEPDAPVETICKGCPFIKTKPGQEPPALAPYIHIANELDLIRQNGGTFAYPEALSTIEWICLMAIQNGRNASETEGIRIRKQNAAMAAQTAEADRARHR